MVIGLIELLMRFFRWLSYRIQGRAEWLVVVQDYGHRTAEKSPTFPKKSALTPDGRPFLVRALPGWAGENPRYLRTAKVRDHIYPPELSAIIPGYVEVLPDKAAATARASLIKQDVLAGRWPWRPEGAADSE